MKRRLFIRNSALAGIGATALPPLLGFRPNSDLVMQENFPITIATWNFANASKKAGEMLATGATRLMPLNRA